MGFTTDQLTRGADYAIKSFNAKDPIDQISYDMPTLDWLIKNKAQSDFLNGSHKDPLYIDHSSNYQNYFGADQVTYNSRDPDRWTDFQWYNNHDGFWFDEDTLRQAGIAISDDGDTSPTGDEKFRLLNLVEQARTALKRGWREQMNYELLRDGSQSTKAIPGLASIIDPTPATGTVGGFDAATYTWWRNNANLTFTAANIVEEMEESWTACVRYGKRKPTAIFCGRAFYDAYIAASISKVQRHQAVMGNGASKLDPSVDGVNFRGLPLIWDPSYEALDTLLGTTTQTKTAYFLNDAVKLRALRGEWMRNRKPAKLPDRYVYYFGQTCKAGLTTDQRNSLAVLSIA